MASQTENFDLLGPRHLDAVNWEDTNDQRSVVASLVNGVYVLEHDRRQKRQGDQALAPPWWDFFHFQLFRELVEDNQSIFGAIYEFKFSPSYCYGRAPNAPRYVIAFRGTISKPDTLWEDFKSNTLLICNRPEKSPRFQLAMQEVQKMVDEAGAANIWLAGHSLGSAIALFAGKNMVKMGYPIETYLFNSPFISPPIEQVKSHKVKRGIRILNSFIKAGTSVIVKDHQQRRQENDTFVLLSAWVPYLFVNPSDHVCEGYIGYFGNREEMVELGAGGIERLATQNSTWGLLLRGKDSAEPVHLVPSAHLTINQSQLTINLRPWERVKQAHGIHQWWMPNLDLQSNLHQFDPAVTSSVLNCIMGWIDARECE